MAKGHWRNWDSDKKTRTKVVNGYVYHVNMTTANEKSAIDRVDSLISLGHGAFYTKGKRLFTVWWTKQKLVNMAKVLDDE